MTTQQHWKATVDRDKDGLIQGYNIVTSSDHQVISGCEGFYSDFDKEAQLASKAPELLETLKYVKRFVSKEDVDMEYIESVIASATNVDLIEEED